MSLCLKFEEDPISSCWDIKIFIFRGHLPIEVVFHWSLSSIEVHFLLKVIFYWMSSFIEGRLPLKVVLSESHLSLKVFFHWRSFSFEGHLLLKVVFHWRSSSLKPHLTLVWSHELSFKTIQGLSSTLKFKIWGWLIQSLLRYKISFDITR